jgi:hypothetical protein
MSAVTIRPRPSSVIGLQELTGRDSTTGLPLEVLAYVFSYLSCKFALWLPFVSRKWYDLVILGVVPWTISPLRGYELFVYKLGNWARASCRVYHAACMVHFVRNAIAFEFGSLQTTQFLMQCMESMQKLKRIQMPTKLELTLTLSSQSQFLQRRDLYDASPTDITHLAVTHIPCILSVCRFTHLTSLLISFGVLNPDQSMHAVESCIQNAVEDTNVLPRLQHFGLHQFGKPERQIATDTIAELVRMRSRLITLSLTGMFRFKQADVRKLVHPDCGLRSLAINVFDAAADEWVNEILNAPQVSLVVLCHYASAQRYRHESIHRVMLLGGFERLRDRTVEIEGQNCYFAQPFRRVGLDVVWGLTTGALFAE